MSVRSLSRVHCILVPDETHGLDVEDDSAGAFSAPMSFRLMEHATIIGVLQSQLLRFRLAHTRGYRPEDVIDRTNKHLHELARVLFAPGTERAHQPSVGPIAPTHDLLFIESIKIVASHRGRKLGLMMVERLRNVLLGDGAAFLALRAKPIALFDHDKPEDWDNDAFLTDTIDPRVYSTGFATSGSAAAEKLRAYFGQIGLSRIVGTDFMALDTGVVLRVAN